MEESCCHAAMVAACPAPDWTQIGVQTTCACGRRWEVTWVCFDGYYHYGTPVGGSFDRMGCCEPSVVQWWEVRPPATSRG